MESSLRAELIVMNVYMNKEETSQINRIALCLKELWKKKKPNEFSSKERNCEVHSRNIGIIERRCEFGSRPQQ